MVYGYCVAAVCGVLGCILLVIPLILVPYVLFCLWIFYKRQVFKQAGLAWIDGRIHDMVELSEKAVASFPNDPDSYLLLSTTYLCVGQPDKALAMAEKALSLEPTNALAFNCCALAKMEMRQLQNALNDCAKALEFSKLESNQIRAGICLTRADIYGELRDAKKAIAGCTAALQVDSMCWAAFADRAYAYTVLKRFNEALSDLETLMHLSPPIVLKAFLFSNRARINLALGNMAMAHEDSLEALKLLPMHHVILGTRGLVLTRDGKPEEALSILSKAIETNRYYAEAYWFRHELYESIGDSELAMADKQVAEGYGYIPYI